MTETTAAISVNNSLNLNRYARNAPIDIPRQLAETYRSFIQLRWEDLTLILFRLRSTQGHRCRHDEAVAV